MEGSNTSQLRSSSFPSSLNPSFSRIETKLHELKTLTPFYTSTCIHIDLVRLIDLYVSVDELIGSSKTQKVNLQYRNKALIEDALAASSRLMDSYSKLVELLAQMKEDVRVLQFALRRQGIYARSEDHLLGYFLSRKKAKKNIVRCLRSFDQLERETESYPTSGEDNHLSRLIAVLRDIVIATISVFRYVLLSLSCGKPKLNNGFSFIKKLIRTDYKPSCQKDREIIKDADILDLTLDSLLINIKKNECQTVEVQVGIERLHKLDLQVEGYEIGLDSLYRKLIQTRVSLLNILAN
ncbi:hypothetical protein SSX86_032398 [Deinandra increscens subsp. villosa]|uniref:Uncharacterized protein n=1 Tax=Deinandra increscens subsp. villosa TaxID=3103831 RepID=A0AAP0C490_9ASTR